MSLIFKNITPSSPYILRHPSQLFKSSVFNFSSQVFICTDNCQRPRGHCKFRDESFVDMVLSSAVSSQKHVLELFVFTLDVVFYPRGFAKKKKIQNIRDYGSGWVGPGLARNFLFGKSSQSSPKPVLIFVYSVCIHC